MHPTILPVFRRFGLAASLLLLSVLGYAQKPCKYVKEVTDPFTKKTARGAQMAVGDLFTMKEVAFEEADGNLYFGISIVFNDMDNIPYKAGDKVSFKLANDDVIEISPAKDIAPRDIRLFEQPARQWVVMQEVAEDVYKRVAASPIVAIKYHLKNDYLIQGISKRQGQKIMENAACMLASR